MSTLSADVLFPSASYNLALKNSNSIKSSTLQLESKKEDLHQWSSKYYPQIDLTIDYNDTDYELNKKRFVLGNKYNKREKSLDSTISLRQSLYNHEIETKLNVEKKRILLYKINLEKEKQELAKDVFKSYLAALNSQNKIELFKSYLLFNEEKLISIEKRYKLNIASKMDLLGATVEVNRSKIDLIKEEKLLKSYLLKLKQLTNLNNIQLPIIDFEKFELGSIINTDDLLKDKNTYLENNLQYQESKEITNMSNLEVLNAKSSYYPKLDFDARYTNFDSDSLTTDYENTFRWSVKLKIPLYSGGYTSSRIKSSKMIKQASTEDLEVVKKELMLKHKELLSLLNTSIKSVDVYKEALASSKSYLEFISQGFENGLKSSIDFYDAKNKVFEIKYEYIKNIQEFIQVYVDYIILNNDMEKLTKIDNIIKKG